MIGRQRRPRIAGVTLAAATLFSGLAVVSAPQASAVSTVTVRVVIQHVDEHGCTDSTSGSDFYSRITIAGQSFNFGPIDGEDEISPDWTAEKVLDVNAVPSATIVIALGESDGGLNFGDDTCDITANSGTDLDLSVPLIPCSVSGDVSGACGTGIFTSGHGDGE